MEKKKKIGMILIAAAVGIGGVFLWKSMAEDTVKSTPVVYGNEKSESVSGSAVETAPPVAATGTPETDENRGGMEIGINPDIIRFMGLTERELAGELMVYANSCGQGAARGVYGTEEMLVDYARGTITVPCYFVTDGQKSGFDMIYQYQRKKYRFVPW